MVIEISRKKLFIALSILVVLIAVPLTVYLSQKQQETESHASATPPDSTTVVTIDGQVITRGDLKTVAEEQIPAESVDKQALVDALNVAEERKILDIEAQKLGVTVDQGVVTQRMTDEDLSQNQAYYEVLKEQITLADVHSVQVTSIGFWSPTSTDSTGGVDSATLSKQLKDGLDALPAIENTLKNSDVMTVANLTLSTFPSLKPVLAVNGYILDTSDPSDSAQISNPRIIEFGDNSLDPSVRDGLFAMNLGDVKTFSNTETNKGGFVYEVIQKGNDNGADSYADWLAGQEDALSIPKINVAASSL